MKKLILIAALCIALSNQAQAAHVKRYFYMGAGYQATDVGYNNLSARLGNTISTSRNGKEYLQNNFNSPNGFVGYQIEENVALELGYFQKKGRYKTNSNTGLFWPSSHDPLVLITQSDLYMANIDVIGSMDLGLRDRFKLLGMLEVTPVYYKYVLSYLDNGVVMGEVPSSGLKLGIGLGAGLELEIIKNVSVRAIAKYISFSKTGLFNNMVVYNANIKIGF